MKKIKCLIKRCLPSGRSLVIGIPYGLLLLLFTLPLLLVLKISVAKAGLSIPPYTPLMTVADHAWTVVIYFDNFLNLVSDDIYLSAYFSSLQVAAMTTLLCLLIGYPIAYCIARQPANRRNMLMMAMMLPFWTSSLVRVYAWIGILRPNGLLNQALMGLHLIDVPLEIYRSTSGVYFGMVYTYLPLMILPLLAHLSKMNLSYLEAAYDLGAKPWKAFWDITLPLSKDGIVAGSLLVFIPAVGEFVVPELLGGTDTLMIGRVMWQEFFGNLDWPMASAVTIAMVILLLLPIVYLQHNQTQLENPSQ